MVAKLDIGLDSTVSICSFSASDDARGAAALRLSEVRRRVHPRAPTGDAHEAPLREGPPRPSLSK